MCPFNCLKSRLTGSVTLHLPFSCFNSGRKWDPMFRSLLWKTSVVFCFVLFFKYMYFYILQVPVFMLRAQMWGSSSSQGTKLDSPVTLGDEHLRSTGGVMFTGDLCLKGQTSPTLCTDKAGALWLQWVHAKARERHALDGRQQQPGHLSEHKSPWRPLDLNTDGQLTLLTHKVHFYFTNE